MPLLMFARININIPPKIKKNKKKKTIIDGSLKKKISNKFFGSKVFIKRKNPTKERMAIRKCGINFFRFFIGLEYQKRKVC